MNRDLPWLLVCLVGGLAVLVVIVRLRGRAPVADAPQSSGEAPSDDAPLRCHCGAPATRSAPLVGIVRPFAGLALANPLRVEHDPDAPWSLCVDHETVKRLDAERFIAAAGVESIDRRTATARGVAEFNARQTRNGATT